MFIYIKWKFPTLSDTYILLFGSVPNSWQMKIASLAKNIIPHWQFTQFLEVAQKQNKK